MPLEHDIKVLCDLQGIARQAAERVFVAANLAIEAKGSFSIALSGGSTPRALYLLLADKAASQRIDWTRVQVFFGDERCVGPDDRDSNFNMANQALLRHLPIPPEQVHRIRGEIDPHAAAGEYDSHLREHFGQEALDMILLGMGDDGHTASLFPDTAALDDTDHLCVANHIDKLKAWRITLTAPFINRCSNVLVLASGSGKARKIHEVLENDPDPRRFPMHLIQPAGHRLCWLLDADAAAML